METLTFKLVDFEGPLDLLLALLQKKKMQLSEIKITELIDQYLEIIEDQADWIDQSSEFIEMAARFVYMKSVFLLPQTEESERLQEELTGMLIEYSLCKEIALKFRDFAEGRDIYVRSQIEVEYDTEYTVLHEPDLISNAFKMAMGRKVLRRVPREEQFDELIATPVVSISSKIVFVIRNVMQGKVKVLKELFSRSESRSDAVATFLALLELIRAGRVIINKNESIEIQRNTKKGA
jgi:Uncharacterized conserved protein